MYNNNNSIEPIGYFCHNHKINIRIYTTIPTTISCPMFVSFFHPIVDSVLPFPQQASYLAEWKQRNIDRSGQQQQINFTKA